MNIELIRSDLYKEIVNKIVMPCSWKKLIAISEYPFVENAYYEKNIKKKTSLNIFKLVNRMNIIYNIDQHVYGILNLNGIDYIIDIDNEFQLHIVGDTESNWLYFIFDLHDNLDTFELFMRTCYEKLGIKIKNPDFDKFSIIEDEWLLPLINKE